MHRFDIAASLERMREADDAIALQRGVLANAIGDETIRAQRNLEAFEDIRDLLGRTHELLVARHLGLGGGGKVSGLLL